jgi:hypothetical protein
MLRPRWARMPRPTNVRWSMRSGTDHAPPPSRPGLLAPHVVRIGRAAPTTPPAHSRRRRTRPSTLPCHRPCCYPSRDVIVDVALCELTSLARLFKGRSSPAVRIASLPRAAAPPWPSTLSSCARLFSQLSSLLGIFPRTQ